MIKDESFVSQLRERFAEMPRTIKRGCSRAVKRLKQHAKGATAAAVVGGGTLLGGPMVEIAQATPPAPFEWEAAPFTVDWGSIGAGIGLLIMGALIIWAGIHVSIHVFKKFTKRTSSTV